MAHIVTLAQAMESAATAVYLDRQKANEQFGRGLFDKAVAHHIRRNLRANLKTGETLDCDGWRGRFTAYDWAQVYDSAPHHVYFDFLRGHVMNSASRLSRGLEA